MKKNELEQLYLQYIATEYAAMPDLDEDVNFIPTSEAKVIIARIDLARREKYNFGLIVGPAGCGKTTTVRWYVSKHGGQYIRAYPNYDASNILEGIATALRITKIRNYRSLISIVEDALRAKDEAIFAIDEAQLCTRNALETMKYLSDETGATFILLTTNEFAAGIRRWRDIESRIGVTASINALAIEEFQSLYLDSGFTPDVITEIYRFTGGIMRDILRLIRQIDHIISLNPTRLSRAVITVKLVQSGASKLNLAGGA